MSMIFYIITLAGGYLLGAVPFGLLYSLMRGVDIRQVGSGNIGATNVGRQFGFWGGFVPVFLLDALKGALPVLLVRLLPVEGLDGDIGMLGAAAAALLGHIFPVYLGFKGGKGVATGAGAFFVLAPIPGLIALGVFLLIRLLFRIVALASIVATLSLPVSAYLLMPGHVVLFWFCLALVPLIIYTHRKNLREMLSGQQSGTGAAEADKK